eukprot:584545-Amphidinium_carterae.1
MFTQCGVAVAETASAHIFAAVVVLVYILCIQPITRDHGSTIWQSRLGLDPFFHTEHTSNGSASRPQSYLRSAWCSAVFDAEDKEACTSRQTGHR